MAGSIHKGDIEAILWIDQTNNDMMTPTHTGTTSTVMIINRDVGHMMDSADHLLHIDVHRLLTTLTSMQLAMRKMFTNQKTSNCTRSLCYALILR